MIEEQTSNIGRLILAEWCGEQYVCYFMHNDETRQGKTIMTIIMIICL